MAFQYEPVLSQEITPISGGLTQYEQPVVLQRTAPIPATLPQYPETVVVTSNGKGPGYWFKVFICLIIVLAVIFGIVLLITWSSGCFDSGGPNSGFHESTGCCGTNNTSCQTNTNASFNNKVNLNNTGKYTKNPFSNTGKIVYRGNNQNNNQNNNEDNKHNHENHSGSGTISITSTAGISSHNAPIKSYSRDKPQVITTFDSASSNKDSLGYNLVNISGITITATQSIEGIDLLGDNNSCIATCNENSDCKGIYYEDKVCYILEDVPEVSGSISKDNTVYLKKDYTPVVTDRVFIGGLKAKLVNSEWWNQTGAYSNGNINVLTLGKTKTWFLNESKYDVINSGKLIGVYTSKSITPKAMKDLLEHDITPPGVICQIDHPEKETKYQLDLSQFGRKTVYITYFSP